MIWLLQWHLTTKAISWPSVTKLAEYASSRPTLLWCVLCFALLYVIGALAVTFGPAPLLLLLLLQRTPSGCDYVDFKFYTEFQSHGPEFDCLKSLEIEERISMLRWFRQPTSGGRFLLSTNGNGWGLFRSSVSFLFLPRTVLYLLCCHFTVASDKTIKLWKVHEKKFYELSQPTPASTLAVSASFPLLFVHHPFFFSCCPGLLFI